MSKIILGVGLAVAIGQLLLASTIDTASVMTTQPNAATLMSTVCNQSDTNGGAVYCQSGGVYASASSFAGIGRIMPVQTRC
jgi:hypothetical protein